MKLFISRVLIFKEMLKDQLPARNLIATPIEANYESDLQISLQQDALSLTQMPGVSSLSVYEVSTLGE